MLIWLFLAGLSAALRAAILPAGAAEAGARAKLVEGWGRILADDANVAGAELSDPELSVFLRGAAEQLGGMPAPVDLRRAAGDLERLQTTRLARVTNARKQRALAAAASFFRRLDRDPRVTVTTSGLGYEMIVRGTGPLPHPRQTVTLRYAGWLTDGAEFTRMDPHDQVLVPNRVMPWLYEGLQLVRAGGKIRLYVPPRSLEGDQARLGVPPGAAAVFEVEVLRVADTGADDLANALLPAAPEPPPAPASGYSADRLLAAWGWATARQAHAVGISFSADDVAAFDRGLRAGIRGTDTEPAPADQRAVRAFAAGERAKVATERKRRQIAAAEALFTKLKGNPRIVVQPDGLRYEVLAPGHGSVPRPHDVVVVDYVGRLLDGTVFDRTDNEPLHIEVGSVIDGLNEGLQKIGVGGRIRLYVPSALGYGDEDSSGVLTRIPANSTLIYEISLLALEPAPAAMPSR